MAITFTISSTSSPSVTVNDTGHGALVGDFVTFSTSNTGNSSLDTLLDNEHEILTVATNSYTINLSENAPATLSASGTANAEYQINIGINTVVPGSGWGAGTWGADGWGSASSAVAGGGTTVGDTEYNYITAEGAAHDQTAGNANVEKGELGNQVDNDNIFPAGVTIYGRWTEIEPSEGTVIAYLGR